MIGTMMGSFFQCCPDYVFMFPMGMGLAGAALATAASPIVSILICSIHFFQKKNTVQFAKTRPSVRMLTASCQLGVPAFVGEFSSGVTTTLFNYLILGLAGNVGVAAYGVIANFALIFTCIFNGISQGAQPLVSRYYGEGNERAVKKILHLGLATGVVFSLLIISLVWGFTDPMVALFNSEHSVKMAEYAFTGMRLYVIGLFVCRFQYYRNRVSECIGACKRGIYGLGLQRICSYCGVFRDIVTYIWNPWCLAVVYGCGSTDGRNYGMGAS